MSANPKETRFAADLERAAKRAFQHGIDAEGFWNVLAGFVGFAMGNAPENGRDDLVRGVGEFGKTALAHALHRRSEIVGAEVVN